MSWHQVQLPAGTLPSGFMKDRGAPRLRAVLEGLLEDHLLDDPAQLHFALQPDAQADAPVWVAVCDRAWLRGALQALEQTGPGKQVPQRLVPEWTPTAATNTLWLTGTEDAAHCVWVDAEGVHLLPLPRGQGLPQALPLPLRSDAEIVAEPAVAHMAEQLLHREVRVMTPQERLKLAAHTDWNLAQFDLARRNPLMARLSLTAHAVWTAPQWRPARWAAVGLVLVQVLGLNAYAWHAQTVLAQQRAAIRSTLVGTFPNVTVVVDAPLQMERELASLRQASGSASNRDLETLLSALGSITATSPVNTAQAAIDFIAGELRLTGTNTDPGQVSSMDAALQPQGFTARLDGNALVLQSRGTP
jgi:general secretion pathway protein L